MGPLTHAFYAQYRFPRGGWGGVASIRRNKPACWKLRPLYYVSTTAKGGVSKLKLCLQLNSGGGCTGQCCNIH